MSKTQTPDTEKENKSKGNPILERKVSIGVVLLFVCIGLFISFISFFFTWQADQSLPIGLHNRKISSIRSGLI